MTTFEAIQPSAVSRQPAARLGEAMGTQHSALSTQNFSSALTAAMSGDGEFARAEEAAASFVAVAFIEPVLASMTKTSFAEGPFAPGDAERRFQPMLHSLLADRIAHAARFPLTDVVAERLVGRGVGLAPRGGLGDEALGEVIHA